MSNSFFQGGDFSRSLHFAPPVTGLCGTKWIKELNLFHISIVKFVRFHVCSGLKNGAHGPYICLPYIKKWAPVFYTYYAQTLFPENKSNFFILSGKLLLRESPFHIVNYLLSFDFNCSLSTH